MKLCPKPLVVATPRDFSYGLSDLFGHQVIEGPYYPWLLPVHLNELDELAVSARRATRRGYVGYQLFQTDNSWHGNFCLGRSSV